MHHDVDTSTGRYIHRPEEHLSHDLPYRVCGECGTPYLLGQEHQHE